MPDHIHAAGGGTHELASLGVDGLTDRFAYTLYRYDRLHFAIDCEACNVKVANLTPGSTGWGLLERLEEHRASVHPDPDPEPGPHT